MKVCACQAESELTQALGRSGSTGAGSRELFGCWAEQPQIQRACPLLVVIASTTPEPLPSDINIASTSGDDVLTYNLLQ